MERLAAKDAQGPDRYSEGVGVLLDQLPELPAHLPDLQRNPGFPMLFPDNRRVAVEDLLPGTDPA